jgi:hypothetical protein
MICRTTGSSIAQTTAKMLDRVCGMGHDRTRGKGPHRKRDDPTHDGRTCDNLIRDETRARTRSKMMFGQAFARKRGKFNTTLSRKIG